MVATIFQRKSDFQTGHKAHRIPPHQSRQTLPHQQIAQTHRQKVKDLLPNRVVGYSPDLARAVGGATIGLFLSQLLFLSDKGHDPNGWVYKSEAEMSRETGLTKREQQTARRKLVALGVIAIERRGFKFTYHFKVIWERLYQVIEASLREQNVPTPPPERTQTVATEPVQTVPTQPPERLQIVSTQWRQTVATGNGYRDNTRENKETERTDQRENQTIWNKTIEQVKKAQPLEDVAARLTGTTLIEVTDTAAWIGVPSTNALVWLERRMYGQISNAIKGVLGRDLDLQFIPA